MYESPKITGQTLSMVFGFTSPAWSLGQAQFFSSFDLSYLRALQNGQGCQSFEGRP